MPDLGSTEMTMLWASLLLGFVYLLAADVATVAKRGLGWALGARDLPAGLCDGCALCAYGVVAGVDRRDRDPAAGVCAGLLTRQILKADDATAPGARRGCGRSLRP